MRITDLLDARSVSLTSSPKTKSEALDQAVALMTKSGKINDEEAYRSQVYAREEESTTGIGEGIAIPHGKCDAVSRPGLAAMVIKNGVDFDSLDGEPVTLLFLIAAPNTKDNVHLDVLSKLSVMLMDEEFTENLRNASSVEEFLRIIDQADEEKASIDERLEQTSILDEPSENKAEPVKKILAVTSCPTGIAHTYMAAEGLEKAAKKLGCRIKIETRGSGGAKNVLTQAEIDEADCIIVAADAKVPMERFNGKKVIDPAKLKEIDPTEIALPFDDEEKAGKEKDGEDKNRKAQGTEWSSVKNESVRKKTAGRAGKKTDAVQRYRDLLKFAVIKQDERTSYVLLGIENQTDVHYAMPVRNAIYDALQYGRQVADIAAGHRRNKNDFSGKNNGEYLSGFLKEDHIRPVITLVIHFGAEEWDGPLSLHEMMSTRDMELLSFVENYRIHLIDPAKLTEEQLDHFSTSLKEVMGYIKYSKNKEQLLKFLHTDTHRSIEMNAVRVIKTITNTPIEVSEEEGEIEMCKAIEDLIAESEARGRAEGEVRGEARGRAEGETRGEAKGMIEICLDMSFSKEDILKKLQEKLNISLQKVG